MSDIASGLFLGLLFGFALERAGFASGCKLTAQLRFQDWAVFNVMFTAILVCATGLYLLDLAGVISTQALYTPTVFLWATLIGGLLIGAGMAVGGYCPGTSVVSFMSGKVDGLVFFVGLLVGVIAFAGAYEAIEPLLKALPGPQGQTLPELLHLPTWLILAALIGVAVAVGLLTGKSDDRAARPAGPTASASS